MAFLFSPEAGVTPLGISHRDSFPDPVLFLLKKIYRRYGNGCRKPFVSHHREPRQNHRGMPLSRLYRR
ncbi:hypothetical protein TNCV_1596651 [Trichonephila clavipes]|nr:hypothetical protein TNCV_1596651 [Trichonephila clavipes]